MSKILRNAMIAAASFCSAWMTFANETGVLDGTSSAVIKQRTIPYGTLQRDLRLCAYPMCGGYLVKPVNNRDLSRAIHVNTLDLSNYDAQTEKLIESFLAGRIIIKGELQSAGVGPGPRLSVLKVTEVYRAEKGFAIPAQSMFIKATEQNPPINCVTAPCPNLLGAILNTNEVMSFDHFDTSAFGSEIPHKVLTSPRVILGGRFVDGEVEFPGGYELIYNVSALYHELPRKPVILSPAAE